MELLIPSFKKSIFDPSLKDAVVDMAEIGLDRVLDNDILQAIPVLRTLVGIGKAYQSIRDRNAMKQTATFIMALREQNIPQNKLDEHKRKLDFDPTFAEEELGRVLVILDATHDIEKSKLLAKIYRAYIENLFDWDRFCELSDLVSRLFVSDISLLRAINEGRVSDTTQCEAYRAERLSAVGLVSLVTKTVLVASNAKQSHADSFLKVTPLGVLFCRVAG